MRVEMARDAIGRLVGKAHSYDNQWVLAGDGTMLKDFGGGRVGIIEAVDYDSIKGLTWYCMKNASNGTYVVANTGEKTARGTFKRVLMHRILLGVNENQIVDHKNGNGLDNRRCNIRIATRSQNMWNKRTTRRGKTSSKYKGVHWFKRDRKWQSQICVNGIKRHLGYFDDEIEAAKAFDAAARELCGEFAYLNFSDMRESLIARCV